MASELHSVSVVSMFKLFTLTFLCLLLALQRSIKFDLNVQEL